MVARMELQCGDAQRGEVKDDFQISSLNNWWIMVAFIAIGNSRKEYILEEQGGRQILFLPC